MKLSISHSGFELTKDIKRHVSKKLGKLDRLVSRGKRRSLRAEVKLREVAGQKRDRITAEVILHIPGKTLNAKEAGMNMFTAIDLVEKKLAVQMRKHKEMRVKRHQGGDKRSFRRLRQLKEFRFKR